MALAVLCGLALIAAGPADYSSPSSADLKEYQSAKSRAGRDPDAQVRLALWCEAHGMPDERVKHLALAVLADPNHGLARGLLGQVAHQGHWQKQNDGKQDETAALAEYNARRDRTPYKAEAQWALAVWCDQKGLEPEAIAHYTAVTRLDTHHSAAWKRLGFKNYRGRWLTDEQVAAEKAEAEAQKKADAYWEPRLVAVGRKYRGNAEEALDAEPELARLSDPRAVPVIWRSFGHSGADQQALAVRLFTQISSQTATRRLAALALLGKADGVRSDAVKVLRTRDLREYMDPLIDVLRKPLNYRQETAPNGSGATSLLTVEGEQFMLKRYYVPVRPTNRNGGIGNLFGLFTQRPRTGQIGDDIRRISAYNVSVDSMNNRALSVLRDLTGEYPGPDRESWRAWWADQQGYAYSPTPPPRRRNLVQVSYYQVAHTACFAAGTRVHAQGLLRPIEDLKVGDIILTQDTKSGALSYQPVVAIYHNKPAATLRIRLDTEEIVATGIHRFWKAGSGWVMARELKPGDHVRTVGGTSRVVSIEEAPVQPVFNLEVAHGSSFFVGERGMLVHDNSLVEPTPEPFDAVASLATIGTAPRTELSPSSPHAE